MDLNSSHRIVHDQAVPLRVNRRCLLQDREDTFGQSDSAVSLRNSQAEASPCCRRPGADVPKLDYVLWSATKLTTPSHKNADCLSDCAVIGIIAL